MVQHAILHHAPRASGNLFFPDCKIAHAPSLNRRTDCIQRRNHPVQPARVIHLAVFRIDIRVIQVPEIVINRSAAGHPAHDGDIFLHQRTHVHLAADVLIASDHDRRRISPDQEDFVARKMREHVFLERLIEKRIRLRVQNGDHPIPPIFRFIISFAGRAVNRAFKPESPDSHSAGTGISPPPAHP